MQRSANNRTSERGSAGVKMLVVLAFIGLTGNAGYNYVPVAYQAESMKTDMETAVLQGLATPGKINPVDNVKSRLQKAQQANELPADTLIDVRQTGVSVTAHVVYAKNVAVLPFGIYTYVYKFDHTATPTGFLLKQ